jgi:SAM-dependent methyltransferase
MKYELNESYWSGRYDAPNVESFIFRFFGRILKHDFGITHGKGLNVFDFGCGEGGALHFFWKQGFDVFGVDIAENDIRHAKEKFSTLADHQPRANFQVIDPKPVIQQKFFKNLNLPDQWIDVAISIQTLDFLSDSDCQIVLNNIHAQMKPGAVIYASFNGTKNYYFQHSTEIESGEGLRHVRFNNGRVNYDLFLNFCSSKEEMKEKFSMFKPLYIDYYDSSFRNEGSEFRWTFCGVRE